ncbi:MAG: hypothetical protein ACXWAY_13590, partial [Acidimicrobiia bacterium]
GMAGTVNATSGSRVVAAVLGALLLVELIVSAYILLAIWPDVAAIPNVAIVTSSKVITSTTTTPSHTAQSSSTTSSSTSSTSSTTSPKTTTTTKKPTANPTPSNPPGRTLDAIDLFGLTWTNPSPDSLYLVTVIALAAIGALVHALTSLSKHSGQGEFNTRWTWWYLVHAPVGIGLALVFYAVIRGGLLSVSTGTTSLSPYGIGAIAALTGMFSEQVTGRLRDVFNALFGESKT